MNELQVFENPAFGQVRTVTKDGEPWFVAKDVCKAFGDTNHNRSVGRIDEEDILSRMELDNLHDALHAYMVAQ